uniref:Uncharacterized protein n=1 Tax=Cacopsylla melanoneura TaxID=428564 RepID=A0A8D9DVR4_9HEMI
MANTINANTRMRRIEPNTIATISDQLSHRFSTSMVYLLTFPFTSYAIRSTLRKQQLDMYCTLIGSLVPATKLLRNRSGNGLEITLRRPDSVSCTTASIPQEDLIHVSGVRAFSQSPIHE